AAMTIQSGGKVTHTQRSGAGLVLSVTGTLTMEGGGTPGLIDANGMGLSGGQNSPGETFDATDAIVAGAANGGAGAGGSYGGTGAGGQHGEGTNVSYGVGENARHRGLGGGGGPNSGEPGGDGGGVGAARAGERGGEGCGGAE